MVKYNTNTGEMQILFGGVDKASWGEMGWERFGELNLGGSIDGPDGYKLFCGGKTTNDKWDERGRSEREGGKEVIA